jgi:chemotaxis protein methyltransferase CheR
MLEKKDSKEELVQLLDVISTNVTNFFREKEHFDYISQRFRLCLNEGQRRFRFWSAGCSSGQEPYTLAIVLSDVLYRSKVNSSGIDIKILATDISTNVLNKAVEGKYAEKLLGDMPRALLNRYFIPTVNDDRSKTYQIRDDLKRMLVYKRLNLSKPPFPMRGPMDAIFCRNTMIYFDNTVRQRLIDEFNRLVKPGGLLIVGHSESLTGFKSDFGAISPSIYEKDTD